MTEKEAQEAKRHKRVDRLKKGIMGLFVFAVLAPIVLTVVFMLRINSLENRLRDVTGNLEKLQAEEQKSAVEAYVSALGNPSGQEGASGQGATAGQEDARGQEDASDEEMDPSLDLFDLVTELEEKYEIEIPTEDLDTLVTVQDVIDYIEKR